METPEGVFLKVESFSNGWAQSSWAADMVAGTDWPRLEHAESAEVAIVGGGVAGASLALNLALSGHQPVLIESDRIGAGAAGVSGGIVAPQLPRHGFSDVQRKLGTMHAEQLFRMLAESGNYLFELARLHAPGSEAAQAGFLAPAMGGSALRRIEQIIADWAPFRSDIRYLDAHAFAELSGLRARTGRLTPSVIT